MGMSIEIATNELKSQIRYYKDFWGADASDYVIDAFNIAIDTMRKYQKIEQIISKPLSPLNYESYFEQIKEVVEDGNAN